MVPTEHLVNTKEEGNKEIQELKLDKDKRLRRKETKKSKSSNLIKTNATILLILPHHSQRPNERKVARYVEAVCTYLPFSFF